MVQGLLLISKVEWAKVSFTPVGSVCTCAEILAELRVWLALVFTCMLERSLAREDVSIQYLIVFGG